MKCTIQNTMLISQSQGDLNSIINTEQRTLGRSSTFSDVHVHATALKTKEQLEKVVLLVYWLPEGLGLSAAASVGPPCHHTHVVKDLKSLYQYMLILLHKLGCL